MTILLEESIRDWVLIPIFLVVVLVSLLREYLTAITKTKPKVSMTDCATQQKLMAASTFEKNFQLLSQESFNIRRSYLINQLESEEGAKGMGINLAAMSDPNKMMGMIKQNLFNIVPNLLLFGFVSYFFSGMLVLKFPFSFPSNFKVMTQRGINIPSLDSACVTSTSLYFLIFLSIKGLFTLLLDREVNTSIMMMNPQGMMGGMGLGASNAVKTQIQHLKMLKYDKKKYELRDAERSLLESFRDEDDGGEEEED